VGNLTMQYSPQISAEANANRARARRVVVIGYHVLLWAFAFQLAMSLRFEGDVPSPWNARRWPVLAILIGLRLLTFYKTGLFHGLWRYAGMPELKSLAWASTLPTLVVFALGMGVDAFRMPRTTYLGEWLASIVLVGGSRFVIRIFRERRSGAARPDALRTLIVGAGDAGDSLLRDMQRAPNSKWVVEGFLDDNLGKTGAMVRDIRILGPADEATLSRLIPDLDIKLVVLAIPTADGARLRQIVDVCRKFKVQTKTMPSLADRIEGQLPLAALREIAIEDLLRRAPVQLDTEQVGDFLEGRTILVTGAAGSIGSELARQVLRFGPGRLLLFDHNENGLFHIERELRAAFPDAQINALIGDMTDRLRVEAVFRTFRPAVVFHAAAHKHVPMMEFNPAEAVKNNVFGTQLVADAAHDFGARAFVMVSTDKAVNPTSIMGATKRIAEMIIQARAGTSPTRYVAVRFGNVLGSAGSVVPIFREQIARGGPVTVTHAEMTRYFMTIPEAAQLVLQAGALGKGGEIFVLDMGAPVKIVDLARDLIELSGLRPDVDIQIEFTGTRPGEKLFEELLHNEETFDTTPHPKIVVGRFQPTPAEIVNKGLATLRAVALAGEDEAIRRIISHMVPEAKLTMSGALPPFSSGTFKAPEPSAETESARSPSLAGVQHA
jgi:FlaA1/EpsC-like NDP-sugar epimerase